MKLFLLGTSLFVRLFFSFAFPPISFEAHETLLNLNAKVTITNLTENAQFIYPSSGTGAYWEIVINKEEFVILSDKPETGNHRVMYKGTLPTFTSELQRYSKNRCDKYLMVDTAAVTIVCKDEQDKEVANSHNDYCGIISNPPVDSNIFTRAQYTIAVEKSDAITELSSMKLERSSLVYNASINTTKRSDTFHNLNNLKKILHAKNVGKEPLSADEDLAVTFRKRAVKDAKKPISSVSLMTVYVGQTVKLPVTNSTMIVSTEKSNQNDTCAITKICDPKKLTHIDKGVVKTTSYGMKYIEFHVENMSHSDEIVTFQLSLQWQDRKIIRKYQVELVTRSLRQRKVSAWSYKSIPRHDLFPDYDQFEDGGCPVGCGPVAWASVFGYLSRRAHVCRDNTPGKKLYQNGTDGMTGSDKKAPKNNDARMKKYISQLHNTLKTFCRSSEGGATFGADMYRVQQFYTNRIPGGKIHLHGCMVTSFFGWYRQIYTDYAIKYINQGFPAIIGWKVFGYGIFVDGHYPIVTRYRVRTKEVRRCSGFWFWKQCKNVTVNEYQFYLHMGGGGEKNDWYVPEAWVTAAATY